MTLPSYATYLMVASHLAVGFLFAALPGSVYQPGYYAVYGAIGCLLTVTAVSYGALVWRQAPGFGVIWVQFFLVGAAVALPFFTVEFSDPWHAILYLPIMGGSAIACLVIGLAVRFAGK